MAKDNTIEKKRIENKQNKSKSKSMIKSKKGGNDRTPWLFTHNLNHFPVLGVRRG